jgi:hypothetical protein
MMTRRSARVAVAIASALLDDGEVVECLVQGSYMGSNAVAVLTDRRLLVVNDKEWKPAQVTLHMSAGDSVEGFGDDRTAALTFHSGGQSVAIESIGDTGLAREMAQRARTQIGEG